VCKASYVKCDCHYAIVTHLTFAGELFAKNSCTKLNENPSHGLVACTGLQTDGKTVSISRGLYFYSVKNASCVRTSEIAE